MISFPSTLNKGGSNLNNPTTSNSAKDVFVNSFKTAFTKSVTNITSNKKLDTEGINYDETRDYNTLVTSMDFTNKYKDQSTSKLLNDADVDVQVLDESKFGVGVLNVIDNYRTNYENVYIDAGIDSPEDDKGQKYLHRMMMVKKVAPSLFNNMYGVNARGITANVPLTDYEAINNNDGITDISDCSIANLVKLSNKQNGPLGLAKYKYADFMYCRDIGKIANNHLITLRKFSLPCGDNIFGSATIGRSGGINYVTNMTLPSDIGRMITWFDNGENKLEDILTYDYEATFVQKEGKIQQLDSQEEDDSRGPMGKIINSFSSAYNKDVLKGTAKTNPALEYLVNKFGFGLGKYLKPGAYANNDAMLGRNYDNNKVYEPRDTVRDTYLYEGKLVFKHEFALTFNYKLRSYDGINPKSAMLDLIGNILTTTYRKGHFWGGSQQILGPQPNYDGWKKSNAFIDKAVNKTGSFLSMLFHDNTLDTNALGGFLSNMLGAVGSGLEKFKEMVCDPEQIKEKAEEYTQKVKKMWNTANLGAAATGMLKNSLGRPSVYAFDSILTGSNVGLWHVTIGNPLNPICVFGNLIMTNCKITHSGPLGIDDFPTDLKVTVSLKHGRGRDAVDISKMYTMGEAGITMSLTSKQPGTKKYIFEENRIGQSTQYSAMDSQYKAQMDSAMASQSNKKSSEPAIIDINHNLTGLTGSDSLIGFCGSYEEQLYNARENEGN